MSCLVPSTALRCCRSSVPLIRQCSNPYRFTTSSTGSASNHPSSSHPKRNPHISNDPRYSVIQNTVEHDAQNWLYPWAISDEMKRSGIASSESLNYLLFSLRHSDMQQSWRVLEEMKRLKVPISKDNLSQLITRAVHNNNLELSLRYLKTLRSQTPPLDIPPEPIQCIIELAARQNHARLAIDVASWWDESGGSPLPKSVWTLCLASAASELYADGLEYAWDKILLFRDSSLTEGLLTIVLQATMRLELHEFTEEVQLALHAQQQLNAALPKKQ